MEKKKTKLAYLAETLKAEGKVDLASFSEDIVRTPVYGSKHQLKSDLETCEKAGVDPQTPMNPENFTRIFQQAIGEIEELSMGLNRESSAKADRAKALISTSEHSEDFWYDLVRKPQYFTFQDRGHTYIKTGAKTIEPLTAYIQKLEKSTIENYRNAKKTQGEIDEINYLVSRHIFSRGVALDKVVDVCNMLQDYIDMGFWSTVKWAFEKLSLKRKYYRKSLKSKTQEESSENPGFGNVQ